MRLVLWLQAAGNYFLLRLLKLTQSRQLLVLDISKLPAVDVIHKEEYGFGGTEITNFGFTESSEFMCTYSYFFQVYKDKIRFKHHFDDETENEFKQHILDNCLERERFKLSSKNDYVDRVTDFEGGFNVCIDCHVTRKRNENITPMNNWGNWGKDLVSVGLDNKFYADIQGNNLRRFIKIINQTFPLVDDMITTSIVGEEDYDEFVPYMEKGVHDVIQKKCIFCKHRCDEY